MEDYKNTGHNGNSRKKEKKGFFARLFGGTGKIGNTSAVNAQASMPESVILRQAGGIPGAGAGKLSAFLATKKGLVLAIVGLTGASVGVSWWLGSAPLMSGNPNVPEFGEKSDYAPYAVRSKMSNGSSIDIISKSGEGLSGIAVNPTAENKEGEGETASAEAVANPADEVKTPEAALPAKENLEEGAKNPLTNVNFGGGGGADVAAKTQIPKAEFSNVMGSVYRPQFAPQFSGKKLTRLSMRARAVKTGDVRRGGRAGAGSTRKALGVMSARVGAAGTTSSSPEMKAAKFEGAWEDKAIAAGGAGLSNIVPGSNSGSGYTPPGGQGGGGGYTPPGGGGGGGDDEEETDCTGKLCSACPGAGCTPDPGETEDKTPWKKHAKAAKAGAIAAVGLIVAATLAGKIPLIGTGLAIPLALAAMAIGGGIIVEGLVITNEHNQPQIGLVYMISGLAIIIAAALAISGINMAKKLANKAIQAAKKQIESTLEVTSKLVSVIPGLDSFNTALRAVAQKLSFSGTVGSLKIAAILLSILAAGYAAFNKAGSAADTSVKTSIEAAQNGTAGGSDSEVTTTGRVPLGSIE